MKKYTDKEIQAKYNEMFGRNPQTKFADVAKALGISEDEVNMALRSMTPSGMSMPMREAKDEKTKWTNTSGKSMYDQFSEINNLNGQEVLIGIDAEMEKNHELTKEEATKIVIKNLKKNPIYYTAEYMSGVEGYEPEYLGGKSAQPEARQMQPLDKNMGNVVDKKMGMQPVKDVEKAKKDSDAATAQKYKTSGISLMSLVAKTVRGVKKMDPTGEKMKNVKLNEGEYTTNWDFKPHQIKQIEDLIDDAEFDVEREEDTTKTTITSKKYADKNIEHAVKQATGQLKSSIKPGIGDAIQNKLEESAEDRLAEQISQYIKEITGAYGGDAMSAEDGSSYINETKLFADFGMESESDDSIESRFARSMSEVAREYDYMDNIDIPGFFDEYEDGDTFYAGPAEALKFFQTLPDEFVVTNNMNNVDESFKITKTGSDTFTAEEI